MRIVLTSALFLALTSPCASFSPYRSVATAPERQCTTTPSTRLFAQKTTDRRNLLLDAIQTTTTTTAATGILSILAMTSYPKSVTSAEPQQQQQDVGVVTDRIFVDIKTPDEPNQLRRIVIGLYGNIAPKSTRMLLQLVSSAGLPSKCKPRDATRTLQKEQLEANKVYNSCIENETQGVNYNYATIWRIIQEERIDVGAVSGKFVAREFPNWCEDGTGTTPLTLPMEFGSVFVERGNESGFGFSIYPGKTANTNVGDSAVIIGKVLEGLDVIDRLNNFPVVKSSKVNYMALTGSDGIKKAPSRACRYGSSNLYCNEFKPLQKLSIVASGVLT